MAVIAFLLLAGPGVLVWKLSDNSEINSVSEAIRILFNLILDCAIVLVASYLTLFLMYGWVSVSFSATYIPDIDKSIYSASFVWKYGAMSGVYAIIFAVIKRVVKKYKKRGKRKNE